MLIDNKADRMGQDVENEKYQEELKAKSEVTGCGSAVWDTLLQEFYVAGKLDLRDKVGDKNT